MTTGVVEALVRQNERVAHEQARLLALVHQVVNAAPDPRFGVDEVAFALTWTHQAAASQEQLAHQLIVDLPEVFTALSDGHIDLPKARIFAEVLGVLDGEIARRVAAEVLPVASEKTTGQVRDRLQRRALAADPQHARRRRERGQAERRVILEAADDGTASLSAFGLIPTRAAAAYERVTAIAKAKKLAGAVQTMDQLRADVLLDLLEGVDIGASPTARRGVVELTVGLETLAGLNSDPGTLTGYGPVAADVARQCAKAGLGYQWRFSVRDDQTGELLFQGLTRARPAEAPAPSPQPHPADEQRPPTQPPLAHPSRPRPDRAEPRQPAEPMPHGPAAMPDEAGQGLRGKTSSPKPPAQDPEARFPNAAMTRWITSRDRTCRAPGCRRPARSCDIDHTVDFGHGGPTTHDNLGAVCRRHHVMKHEGGWQLVQPRPGQFVWVSPRRRVYVVRPEPP